jgi:acyl-CoA thioesterase-1
MKKCFLLLSLVCGCLCSLAQADTATYLSNIKTELVKQWPKNRTINLVFHGHSVPSGYFKTPDVRTMDAYPAQVLKELKALYPYAVINSIVTAIGGENSVNGEKRFEKDVLVHQPDVLFIDYALNDRNLVPNDSVASLKRSQEAVEKMVKAALAKNIKVILMTPSPDQRENILQPATRLQLYTNMLIDLAKKYNVGLANSYAAFKQQVSNGQPVTGLMSQVNHPNEKGHALIATEILKWFK